MARLTAARISQLGDDLFECLSSRSPIEPLTDREPDPTVEQPYRIQEHLILRRLVLGSLSIRFN